MGVKTAKQLPNKKTPKTNQHPSLYSSFQNSIATMNTPKMNESLNNCTQELFSRFTNADSARLYFERIRWNDRKECPRCSADTQITARKGKRAGYYCCGACREEFSVRTNTIFERSHVPLHKWIFAIYLSVSLLDSISSTRLSKQIGVTQKTAWYMQAKLREVFGTQFRHEDSESSVMIGLDRASQMIFSHRPQSPMPDLNNFYVGDSAKKLKRWRNNFVDLTVTSPPYDDLRDYKGYQFRAESMLSAIYRVTKPGGVCVWVVGEKINKKRSLSSFQHAFVGQRCGFNVHDVMIYQKKNTPFMRANAYTNCYELMIIFVKGKPNTFNPIKVPTVRSGWETAVYGKGPDAVNKKRPIELKREKTKNNIWQYAVGFGGSTTDKIAFEHPAIFPEKLAEDHILSWSNPGDIVLDPMCGSGTTCKMAEKHGRRWLGIDVSEDYINIARERIETMK